MKRPATFKPTRVRATRALAVGYNRGTTTQRGYGADWERVRELHLNTEPLCRACWSKGKHVPATEVDHIVRIALAPGRRLDDANLQSLCKSCHSRKTYAEEHGRNVERQARPW